jgi:hypothetical protein
VPSDLECRRLRIALKQAGDPDRDDDRTDLLIYLGSVDTIFLLDDGRDELGAPV